MIHYKVKPLLLITEMSEYKITIHTRPLIYRLTGDLGVSVEPSPPFLPDKIPVNNVILVKL